MKEKTLSLPLIVRTLWCVQSRGVKYETLRVVTNLLNLNLEIARKQQMPQIKKLYKSAFPRNERKPFFIISRKHKQGNMEILSLNDGSFAGLCITMFYQDLVLLDYFAIDETIRGKGYGREALIQLRKRYKGRRFFLEIEKPEDGAENNEERIRRKKFYLENGFLETQIVVNLFGVTMELLCYDCKVTFEEYYGLYQSVLGDFIVKRNITKHMEEIEREK